MSVISHVFVAVEVAVVYPDRPLSVVQKGGRPGDGLHFDMEELLSWSGAGKI